MQDSPSPPNEKHRDRLAPAAHAERSGEAISGLTPRFHYRGQPLEELARTTSYWEVACLLIDGESPSQDRLADWQSRWEEIPLVDATARDHIVALPWNVSLLESLRSGLVFLSHFEERNEEGDDGPERAVCLLSDLATLTSVRYCATQGVPLPEYAPSDDLSTRLLTQLCGEPPGELEHAAFDRLLLLLAESPGAPSSVAVRAAADAGATLSEAVVSGLYAFEGRGWGTRAEEIYELLDAIESEEQLNAVCDRFCDEETIPPGFEFAPACDERTALLTELCRRLGEDRNQAGYEELALQFERQVAVEQGLVPQPIWALTRLFHYLGLELELIPPLAALARIPAWCAHYRGR